MPSPDRIRVMQEAHAREHARAIRAVPAGRNVWRSCDCQPLSEEERAELKAAIERLERERPGNDN